jgi:hypothetical protein
VEIITRQSSADGLRDSEKRVLMDDPRLPGSYGKTRLVLLVVDPYLIHAYWEVAPEKLQDANEPVGLNKGVLRFYRRSETAPEDTLRDSFDIEVELQSRNWYVHLWSPEESLYADLSLKRNDGTLVRLVRSQVVHMPRTRPAVTIDERFMRVEATERRAQIVPAPALAMEHERLQQDAAGLPDEFHAPPIVKPIPARTPVNEHNEPQQPVTTLSSVLDVLPTIKPSDSEQLVRKTIQEVYASVQWGGSPSEPETVRDFSTPPPGRAGTELTAIAERNFDAGMSSSVLQKNHIEGGPDSKK